MTRPRRDVRASVKQRLLNLSKSRGEEFEQLLVRYAVERFLYRLSVSKHRADFVLKGAMLFVAWEGMTQRATRDVDLLGFGDESVERVTAVVREICGSDVENDGLVFDSESVRGEAIRGAEEYGGVRVTFRARLASAVIRVQVDVGFGDAVTPRPVEIEFPTLLDSPKPRVRAYPVETVVAEKVLAIIVLGLTNSRMKDYFDLLHLSRTRGFDGALLVRALRATAERRGVTIPPEPPTGLAAEFGVDESKQKQWRAFIARTRLASEWADFGAVVQEVAAFLGPVVEAAAGGEPSKEHWIPKGPWK